MNDLESDTPYIKSNPFSMALSFIPIISLIPIENIKYTNSVHDWTTRVCIGNDEIERIIVGELGKSGIVKEVTYRGEPKDYDIRGRVNFVSKWYCHYSGLGIFYCKVLLSKDYIAEDSSHIWLFYNMSRMWTIHGTKVFPKILRQFIADLEAIPPSEWIKPLVKVKL